MNTYIVVNILIVIIEAESHVDAFVNAGCDDIDIKNMFCTTEDVRKELLKRGFKTLQLTNFKEVFLCKKKKDAIADSPEKFLKIGEELIQIKENALFLQKNLCSYGTTEGDGQRCDCKFSQNGELQLHSESGCGCAEARSIIFCVEKIEKYLITGVPREASLPVDAYE